MHSIIKSILIGLINTLRPLLGPAVCHFEPTCTPYAIKQLETQPLLKALTNIFWRLLSCGPFIRQTIPFDNKPCLRDNEIKNIKDF